MSDTNQVGIPPQESLRRHVLAPLETAESVIDSEYAEVDAERCAFEELRGRIAAVETVADTSPVPATRTSLRENRSRAAERVRSAYRETVMDVDHYDDVYGESLIEHAAAELSDEVAAGLRRDGHVQFTPLFKRALLTGVNDTIDQRETFCAILNRERISLDRSRDSLLAVLDELDGTRVPVGARGEFTDALDEIARHRQETFASRTASPHTDGHDLCGYLYADCDWTYPVLTAVTRFRGTINGAVT